MAKAEFGIKECAKCEYNVRCQECIYNKEDISRLIAETKTAIVRKMQKRLKEEAVYKAGSHYCTSEADIDQIAKEMLEEVK